MYDIMKQWIYVFHEIGKLMKNIEYLFICIARLSQKCTIKNHLNNRKCMISHLGDICQNIIVFLHLQLLILKYFQKPLIRTSWKKNLMLDNSSKSVVLFEE